MPYSLWFPRAAAGRWRRLPQEVQARIRPRIDALADNPRPRGNEKIRGAEDIYRIRVGDHRVLYQIDDSARVLTVVDVAHRKDTYRP